MGVILFEGMDMTGKSTIAKEYGRKHSIDYFKNPNEHFQVAKGETRQVTKYAGVFFAEFIKQVKINAIIDRHYPSEWVYSQVLKREHDEEILKYIDICFEEANVKIIICHSSLVHVSYKAEQHGLIDINSMMKINSFYKSFAHWTNCDTLLLDTSAQDLETQITTIEAFINNGYK